MIVTTGNEIAKRNITQYVGIVRGIVGGFKSILGGHIEEFTEVLAYGTAVKLE